MFFKILIRGTNGQVYNVSNDKNVASVLDIAKTVRDIFNRDYKMNLKIEAKKQNKVIYKNAVRRIVLDISKFKKTFNYTPSTNIHTSFKKTIDFYKS